MSERPAVHELTLERYRLGELPEAEAQAVRDALEADPRLRERLAQLENSDRAILEERPVAQVAVAIERRLAEREPGRRALVPVLALSAALVVASALLAPRLTHGPGGDRTKGGGPSLLLFRKGPSGGVERLDAGAVAHAADVLQVAYQAGGRRYGVILSIDGRGVVTRHYPASGDEAAPLQSGGPGLLPSAYRLDDAPQLERFYLVAGDAPFALAPIVAAAESAGRDPRRAERLPLPAALVQTSFLLRKE